MIARAESLLVPWKNRCTFEGLARPMMAAVVWSKSDSSSGLETRHASRRAMPNSYLPRCVSQCAPTKSRRAAIASSSVSMI